MSGLRDFGTATAAGIEANIGPAHDAALAGDDYFAGQKGLWSVEAVAQGPAGTAPEAHVLIKVYAG